MRQPPGAKHKLAGPYHAAATILPYIIRAIQDRARCPDAPARPTSPIHKSQAHKLRLPKDFDRGGEDVAPGHHESCRKKARPNIPLIARPRKLACGVTGGINPTTLSTRAGDTGLPGVQSPPGLAILRGDLRKIGCGPIRRVAAPMGTRCPGVAPRDLRYVKRRRLVLRHGLAARGYGIGAVGGWHHGAPGCHHFARDIWKTRGVTMQPRHGQIRPRRTHTTHPRDRSKRRMSAE